MAELADAQDLGSCAFRCVGSTPTTRTIYLPLHECFFRAGGIHFIKKL